MATRHIFADTDMLSYEYETTFGTDPAGSKTTLKAFDITFDEAPTFHDVAYQKHDNYRGPDARIPGADGGVLKFKMYNRYVSASSSQVIDLLPYSGFHKSPLTFSYTEKTNVAMETGTNSTTMVIANADATDLFVGMGVFHVPSTGTPSTRFIISKDIGAVNTTLVFNAAFATAPVATRDTDELGAMYSQAPMNEGDGIPSTVPAGANANSLTFYLDIGSAKSSDTDYMRWKFMGCNGKWKTSTWTAGGLPIYEFEFQVDNFSFAETAGSSTANDTALVAAPLFGSRFYYNGTLTDIKSFMFDPGWEMGPLDSMYGNNGRSSWHYPKCAPKMEVDPLHDIDFLTYFCSGACKDVMFECTPDAYHSTAIWMRYASIDSAKGENSNNLIRRKLQLIGRDPGTAVQETADGDGLTACIPMFSFAQSFRTIV